MSFPMTDKDASPSSPAAHTDGTQFTKESILRDYRIAYQSRQASLIGRREVFTGKAKFGIFGDGKEVAQVALARAFRPGDFRSGYYRDQTLMIALGLLTLEQFFAQLYADADLEREPCSAGRSMTAHFSTCMLETDGRFKGLVDLVNVASDVSPTGSQMPRLVGLSYASRLYRELPELREMMGRFSRHGDEVAFGTIGNASCAEGMFWEAVNAVGVLQSPMLLSIWDDGYGISVPNEHQITKGDLSAVLSGFRREPGTREGYDLYTVKGWDYAGLCETYLSAVQIVRREHVPAIVHVTEMTQPQGHSTSGSHERYKSRERLDWEVEFDPVPKMRQWMIEQGIATAQELDAVEEEDQRIVREAQRHAWEAFRAPIDAEKAEALGLLEELARESAHGEEVRKIRQELERQQGGFRRDLMASIFSALVATAGEELPAARRLVEWKQQQERVNEDRYNSHLYSTTPQAAVKIEPVPAVYRDDSPVLNGFEVLNACFDAALARRPNVIAIGEDVGKIGDVNRASPGSRPNTGQCG